MRHSARLKSPPRHRPRRSPQSDQAPSALLASPLAVPGAEWLDEGTQLQAGREARRSSPEAFIARRFSQTAYAGIGGEEPAKIDGEAFPGLIKDPAGGPPPLPLGQEITDFPDVYTAQVRVNLTKHALITSAAPMAIESAQGKLEPIDLSLGEVGGVFQPARPRTPVEISKRLNEGVHLTRSGVGLTPVDAQGSPLAGAEGKIDGATVFYANTQTNTDAVVKPLTAGFQADTLLRSKESPGQLFFRFDLPQGTDLEMASDGSEGARILKDGDTIASVRRPIAQDAEGTLVPVSMTVSGDTLTMTVDHTSREYRYPIDVDPTVEENAGGTGQVKFGQTWGFYRDPGAESFHGYPGVVDIIDGPVAAGQRAYFYYRTQGQSHIYEFRSYSRFETGNKGGYKLANVLGIVNTRSKQFEPTPPSEYVGGYSAEAIVCPLSECATGSVTASNEENEAIYEQYAREAETLENRWAQMSSAYIYIVQEAPPRVTINTTDPRVGGVTNAAYPGTWVKEGGGWVSVNSLDPGVGVLEKYWSSSKAPGWGNPPGQRDRSKLPTAQWDECFEAACKGLVHPTGQPFSGPGEPWYFRMGYERAPLPEGEDPIEASVEDAVGLKTGSSASASTKAAQEARHSTAKRTPDRMSGSPFPPPPKKHASD